MLILWPLFPIEKLEILPASKYPVKGSFDDCQQQVHEELIKLQVNRWNRKEITMPLLVKDTLMINSQLILCIGVIKGHF